MSDLEDTVMVTDSVVDYCAELPPGFVLDDRYEIIDSLGKGAFGITYRVRDRRFEDRVCVAKEFWPNEWVQRVQSRLCATVQGQSAGENFLFLKKRFLEEAEQIALFQHRNIVRVSDQFLQNNTAYFIMDYEKGKDLKHWLAEQQVLEPSLLIQVLKGAMAGLATVHAQGILHRDIKPSNIYIRENDGSPILIDFGAARAYQTQQQLTCIYTPGYAPPEQECGQSLNQVQNNARVQPGPWSDIYALAATIAHGMVGRMPPSAQERLMMLAQGEADPLEAFLSPAQYSPFFKKAILSGMHLEISRRPASIEQWLAMFELTLEFEQLTVKNSQEQETQTLFDAVQPQSPVNASNEHRFWGPFLSRYVLVLCVGLIGVLCFVVMFLFFNPNESTNRMGVDLF